jgi:hypothetical protein
LPSGISIYRSRPSRGLFEPPFRPCSRRHAWADRRNTRCYSRGRAHPMRAAGS